MYKVIFHKKADKDLSKISKTDAKRVIEKLQLIDYPFPKNFDLDKMEGDDNYLRLRVGTVRVIFEIDHIEKEIWIRKVKYRGQVYKN